MLTAALILAFLAVCFVGWSLARAAARPDPVDQAYDSLPAGRPELRVDTATGSHDRLPIQPDIRQMLTDYCEGMLRHTTEDTK